MRNAIFAAILVSATIGAVIGAIISLIINCAHASVIIDSIVNYF